MQFSKFYSIILCSFLVLVSQNVKAETSTMTTVKPAVTPAVMTAPSVKPSSSPVQAVSPSQKTNNEQCLCAKPAADALNKAYTALEEDEWTSAENTTKNAINSIKSLSQTCKCPELVNYQKIAEAYLKYAQGGNHLDGSDQPNCPFALKLYNDALALFKEAIPGISNVEVKTNASNIQDYADEELQFVKDECEDIKPTPQPTAKKP